MSEVKVPEGYKQTEAGVIPKDWEVKNFGELFESSIPRKTIKPSNLVTFVGMQDVTENAQLAHQTIISYERVKSGFTYFEKGDVLLAKITPCFENGKGCHTKSLETKYGFGSTEFHVLRANSASDSKFIYFWTTHSRFRIDLESAMVGSAGHRRVPFSEVRSYQIPCPASKSEQTAIATALSDVDNLIQSLEKLIAKKEAIKTGTMQQLLTGKTRLPEFATRDDGSAKGFKQTELGRIPEDWEVVRIIDNHIIATGNTPPTNDQRNYKGKFLFVSPADLGANKLIHNTQKKLSSTGFKLARKFPKGSTLFTCIGSTIGKTGLATCELTSNQQINAVFPNEIDDFEFTYYALTHHSKRIKNKASEQAVPLINKTEFGQFEYMQPNELKEQNAIATILSDMDAEIQALHQRLEKTKDIKQGMMQQLLTGKVRLVNPSDKSDTQTLASKGELQA